MGVVQLAVGIALDHTPGSAGVALAAVRSLPALCVRCHAFLGFRAPHRAASHYAASALEITHRRIAEGSAGTHPSGRDSALAPRISPRPLTNYAPRNNVAPIPVSACSPGTE